MIAVRRRAADLNFYFDPVCPFAWLTSTWVRQVAAQRDFAVDWRFISLRLLNAHLDYAAHFPPDYEAGHTAGLRLLRVAARVRAEHGREAVGPLYEAFGRQLFEVDQRPGRRAARHPGVRGPPPEPSSGFLHALADALDDESADVEIQAETDEALRLTGKDVGTPILHFRPPHGTSFFGPVISRRPSDARTPSSSGTTWSRWPASPVSPSSSAAGASGPSCRPSVSARARRASRRTGAAAAGGRSDEAGRLRNELAPGRAAGGMSDLLDVPLATLQGEPTTLRALTGGGAALVVNVASRCGLTPQYAGLEALQKEYGRRGLTVIGVPCNQFKGQEPGTAERDRGVLLRHLRRHLPDDGEGRGQRARGAPALPGLTAAPDAEGTAGDVQWNFEKLLFAGRARSSAASARRPSRTPRRSAIAAIVGRRWPRLNAGGAPETPGRRQVR